MNERTIARFRASINVNGPLPVRFPELGPCHLWIPKPDTAGYGRFKYDGKDGLLAHRVAFFLKNGHYPEPFGCHKCRNRRCCNADHVYEGTPADNVRDRGDDGNTIMPNNTGSRNGRSKLTEHQVREIKRLLREGDMSQGQIGRLFGVGNVVICQIKQGTRWAHIE